VKRWLPSPRLSVCLLALWLLLNQSLAPAHLLFGALPGVGLPLAAAQLLPDHRGPRRPMAALRLFGLVVADILRSNLAVARLIVHRGHRRATAAFIFIPLELRNAYGLTLLACIITSTPGTLWVDYDGHDGVLMLHVLDLVDEEGWIHLIKNRYERLLLEIFE
jgi:multicomponent K+:H+ antiporter subunit E